MQKVLITGSQGMLGSDLANTYTDKGYQVISCTRKEFDITNIDETLDYIIKSKPDLVLHPAAYTNVDGCESNQDYAYKVNALGTRNVAVACKELDIPMVYYSTDYVFDGENSEGYKEFDITNPLGVYGASKLAGEKFVQHNLSKFYIIRVSWLCGHNGKNFINTILRLAKERNELTVVNDQTGTPTFTTDIAEATIKLVGKPTYGIFHVTNSGYCTWYQFAQDICNYAGINAIIKPITTEELGRPAQRPKNSILHNYHWVLEGYKPLRNYKDALQDYIKKLEAWQ